MISPTRVSRNGSPHCFQPRPTPPIAMRVFVGTTSNNTHLHQVGQALDEAGFLSRFMVPFAGIPFLDLRALANRRPVGITPSKVSDSPSWEILRLVAAKLNMPNPWVDLIWERQ